jgi:hypothetical protein
MSSTFADRPNTFPDILSISGPRARFARFTPSSLSVIAALSRYTDEVRSSARKKFNDSYRKSLLSDGKDDATAFLGNINSTDNNSGGKQHLTKPKGPILHYMSFAMSSRLRFPETWKALAASLPFSAPLA